MRHAAAHTTHLYQGKALDAAAQWYHFGSRWYDARLGLWNATDPAGQMASPYTAMGGNPVVYVDPDGELIWLAVAIGAAAGGYMGYNIADAKGYDIGDAETWGYMLGGAAIGGASGWAGGAIAASGIPMANTAAIVASSTLNSTGMWALSGGQTDFSTSFGFGSYNWTRNTFETFDTKKTWLQNIGYGFGALAFGADLLAGFNPGEVQLNTESSDKIGHSAITKVGETNPNSSYVSVGPDPGGKWIFNPFKFNKGKNDWNNYAYKTTDVRKVIVRGINVSRIKWYSEKLNEGVNYNLYFSSCVNHTARALTLSGVPAIGIHPHLLHFQMYLRDIGVRPGIYQHLFQDND